MSFIHLTEDDVRRHLTMEMALEAVEEVLRLQAQGEAQNVPRARCQTADGMLHVMSAAVAPLGLLGYKAYCTTLQGAHFHVGLFDGTTGTLLALMEADYLGQVRTGAASGVATQYMARPDADEVGLFGAGKQARTQLLAVCKVRNIRRVQVYSRDDERRRRFCAEMGPLVGCDVEPVPRPELAAQDKDIVITATSSATPVLHGEWLGEGTHLNVIGSNFLKKAEVDDVAVRRSEVIAVDSIEQAKIEAGDFVQALATGSIHWGDVHELGEVILGRHPGRRSADDVTLFKSVGVALEDVAVAARVYEKAKS
jgi:alanine dehydrogenase